MSAGIEFSLTNFLPVGDTSVESAAAEDYSPESSFPFGGENGAIFFNLDWQNQLASRRQQTTERFFNSMSPPDSINEDTAESIWNRILSRVRDREEFARFRSEPKDFWQRVRRFSEPRPVEAESNGSGETQRISRYTELLTQLNQSGMSPPQFIQTLPPSEQMIFAARYQIDQFFAQNRFVSTPNQPNENAPGQIADGGFSTVESVEPNTFGGETVLPAYVSTNRNAGLSETEISDFSATAISPNQTANLILTESAISRRLNNSASDSAPVNQISRHESGTILGGALITGAFNSIEEHRQMENNQIGGSRAVGVFYDAAETSFAAGATGAMMSAAIGSVIPSAGTDVSGVLGFVSGVVVGVEVDEGLRWLGADKM